LIDEELMIDIGVFN